MAATLYYIHDPMCSWCWAFRPVWQQVKRRLPSAVRAENLLGGLAPDTDQPMSQPLREQIEATWRRIQQRVPGTEFNFAFWRECSPRRSTYPACRSVIAARLQDPACEEAMILAIQEAYYLAARNPSQESTLLDLAREIGLDAERLRRDLRARDTQLRLQQEMALSRRLGGLSFPSLFFHLEGSTWPVAVDYRNPDAILRQLRMLLPPSRPLAGG